MNQLCRLLAADPTLRRTAEKAAREPLAPVACPKGLRPPQREGESREVYRARIGLKP